VSDDQRTPALTGDQIEHILQTMADSFAGSLSCARTRHDTRAMTIGLFSRCLGCSSAFAAMMQFPGHSTACAATRRWDGYLEFQRRPEPMLEWFAKHMD
jgi:hypothetical protein